jgi:hypothetical protein
MNAVTTGTVKEHKILIDQQVGYVHVVPFFCVHNVCNNIVFVEARYPALARVDSKIGCSVSTISRSHTKMSVHRRAKVRSAGRRFVGLGNNVLARQGKIIKV